MIEATVDIRSLPTEVQRKIPISIRVKQPIYQLSELPTDVQYLIYHYLDEKIPSVDYADVIDIRPQMSIYGDFEIFTDSVDTVLNYFKNYLQIRLGSYPFDISLGCKLKDFVQAKDTTLSKTLIMNEAILIAAVLGNDYKMDITISSIDVQVVDNRIYSEYNIIIQLKVQGEFYEVEVQA